MLLKLLLKELSKLEIETIIFLGYDHVIEDLQNENYRNLEIVKTNTKQTFFRYLKKREDVVYLCNLPPFTKNKKSYLVFYNELFFKKKNIFSKSGIKFSIFKFWFKWFHKNVDSVIVQSKHMEELIISNTHSKNVINIPIYKKFNKSNEVVKQFDFCFISSSSPHKNHLTLLDALELLLEEGIKTNLIVTVPNNANAALILEKIEKLNALYPGAITNVGHVDNSEIENVYLKSKALVFPSKAEAFGMPLIEAHDLGLKVLVSNLPYAFDVFEEVTTFDPENKLSIAKTMKQFLNGELNNKKQTSKVINKLDDYVKLLTEDKYDI